ncbi:histidinol-phosphatase HisJ [Candidatus Harpocratesius sp.]
MCASIQDLWDYHIHSKRCGHAVGKLQEYVQQAIKIGLQEIGLSDHFPMFFLPKEANAEQFAMPRDQFAEYLEECRILQSKYSDKIQIKIASEVDYYPDQHVLSQLYSELKKYESKLDYLIGSIHIIKIDDEIPFPVDSPDIMEKFQKYGEETIFSEYYKNLIKMVKTGVFQIVGHCDLPKKYGTYLGRSEAIWDLKMKFLNEVKRTGEMAVEINHSGLYRPVKEQYPHDEMIKACIEREIPLVFGSDAHRSSYVGYHFEETLKKCINFANSLQKPLIMAKFTQKIIKRENLNQF